jgi:hypothetical protein
VDERGEFRVAGEAMVEGDVSDAAQQRVGLASARRQIIAGFATGVVALDEFMIAGRDDCQ